MRSCEVANNGINESCTVLLCVRIVVLICPFFNKSGSAGLELAFGFSSYRGGQPAGGDLDGTVLFTRWLRNKESCICDV